jgi:hypothetical protein
MEDFLILENFEMKNLLSKITKPLLIPALALGLSTGIKAQDENIQYKLNKLKPDIYFTVGFNLGITHSEQNILKLQDFNYLDNAEKRATLWRGDFPVGLEPIIRKGNFELGFPVYIYLSDLGDLSKTSEKISTRQYKGGLTNLIQDITLKKTTPAFGVSIRDKKLKIEYLLYKYKLLRQAYEYHTRVICGPCGTYETSGPEVVSSEKLRTGWSQNLSGGLFYEAGEERRVKIFTGAYFEHAYKFNEFGGFVNVSLSPIKKEE